MSEIINKLWQRLSFVTSQHDKGVTPDEGVEAEVIGLATKAANSRLNNMEISDLQFVERVLEEAHNPHHPLLERLRFLAISADVLDQFYSVRVAKMKRSTEMLDAYITPDGLTPAAQLAKVRTRGKKLMKAQQETWHHIRKQLADVDIRVLESKEVMGADSQWLSEFFSNHVLPVLTPTIIDEEHPFPFIPSGGLCAILAFGNKHILIPLPANLPRFVPVPGKQSKFVLLEHLIEAFWSQLLPFSSLDGFGVFQILRDNDLARQERSDDLRAMVESGLRLRHKANPVLLKVDEAMPKQAVAFVLEHLSSDASETKEFKQTMPLPGLSALAGIITKDVSARYAQLLFKPFSSRMPMVWTSGENVFDVIREGEQLYHWPYESFDTVIQFLRQAARDPDVLSVKQTLYRTSNNSPIVDALIDAANHGKAVTTVIELEAREDELTNVELAKRLEQAGVQVSYGIIGLKIHCKATLVVRREGDETCLYAHLATGNYHAGNAKRYTDLSFFTRDQAIGRDLNLVFNYITSGQLLETKSLVVSPMGFRPWLKKNIDREIEQAKLGRSTRIIIKVNSFTDPDIAEQLYRASAAGVQIDLLVRRHCIVRPGVAGMSENIRVKSLVGRFLEHARIYAFSGGCAFHEASASVFVGSADIMERNLDERVEIVFPLNDARLRSIVVNEVLHANIVDTRQSWILKDDNEYHRHAEREGLCAQSLFMQDQAGSLGDLLDQIDTNTGHIDSKVKSDNSTVGVNGRDQQL
jgi:polyphosphate kinase